MTIVRNATPACGNKISAKVLVDIFLENSEPYATAYSTSFNAFMSLKQRNKALHLHNKRKDGVSGKSFYGHLDPHLTSNLESEVGYLYSTHQLQTVPLEGYVKGFLDPALQPDKILKERVEGKVLLLDNSQKTPSSKVQSKKRKRISNREAKRKGLFTLDPEECKCVPPEIPQ